MMEDLFPYFVEVQRKDWCIAAPRVALIRDRYQVKYGLSALAEVNYSNTELELSARPWDGLTEAGCCRLGPVAGQF